VIELLGGRRGVVDVRAGTLWALAWALEVEDFAGFLAPLTQGVAAPTGKDACRDQTRVA
jgi:hypothetical protein